MPTAPSAPMPLKRGHPRYVCRKYVSQLNLHPALCMQMGAAWLHHWVNQKHPGTRGGAGQAGRSNKKTLVLGQLKVQLQKGGANPEFLGVQIGAVWPHHWVNLNTMATGEDLFSVFLLFSNGPAWVPGMASAVSYLSKLL